MDAVTSWAYFLEMPEIFLINFEIDICRVLNVFMIREALKPGRNFRWTVTNPSSIEITIEPNPFLHATTSIRHILKHVN